MRQDLKKSFLKLRRVVFFGGVLVFCQLSWAFALRPYPVTPKDQTEDRYFGTRVTDPYRWLENGRSPLVQKWVHAQDQYARQYLAVLPGREKLSRRLKTLLYTNEVFAPVERGGRIFYERRLPNQEKRVLYWRDRDGGEAHVLLDPNRWNPKRHSSLGEWSPSPDGKKLAYLLKPNNADEAVLCVLDVTAKKNKFGEIIPGANFADPAWSSDSEGFYYMRLPSDSSLSEAVRVAHADIRFHRLGNGPLDDVKVYPQTGDGHLYLSPATSMDGHWLFVYVLNGWSSNDIYAKDLQKPDSKFEPIFLSTTSTAAVIEQHGYFYLNTDEGAPNHRVVRLLPEHVDPPSWATLVPERKDVIVQDMKVIGDSLVLNTLKKAASQMEVRSLDGRLIRTLPMPGIGRLSDLSGRENGSTLHYQFESFTTPPQIYKVALPLGDPVRWAKEDVPVDASAYQVSQVWFPSKDSTPISMFVVTRGSAPAAGPFLLQGYGGFNEPMLPRFDAALFPWLEAGGGYALVNLRGGGEYGEAWHQAGMLTHKQNTFDDFTAAAHYLIRQRYTTKDLLAIEGASNGGLLVAAALTQHPELFRAVICKVPLTDMIRYSLVGEGPAWTSEYGTVSDEPKFRALLAYSPYHHVTQGALYPSVLFLSGENDDRVDPMHVRKMTAALQASTGSSNPILLRTQAHAGHGGSDAIDAKVDEWTDRFLFLQHELGMNR